MSSDQAPIKLDANFLDRTAGENSLDLISSFDSKPDLKMLTKFGVFLWGSDQLNHWVHPDELELAERIVPGYRVFRRTPCESQADRDAGYARLHYGDETFRALPIVWLEVTPDGYEVGDRVEIKSEQGKRQPGIATIEEMKWNRYTQEIEYHLRGIELKHERVYAAKEMRPAVELNSFLKPHRY